MRWKWNTKKVWYVSDCTGWTIMILREIHEISRMWMNAVGEREREEEHC